MHPPFLIHTKVNRHTHMHTRTHTHLSVYQLSQWQVGLPVCLCQSDKLCVCVCGTDECVWAALCGACWAQLITEWSILEPSEVLWDSQYTLTDTQTHTESRVAGLPEATGEEVRNSFVLCFKPSSLFLQRESSLNTSIHTHVFKLVEWYNTINFMSYTWNCLSQWKCPVVCGFTENIVFTASQLLITIISFVLL